MKARSYIHTFIIATAALMAAASCNKEVPENQHIAKTISISASESAKTKALLDKKETKSLIESEDDFSKEGNRIQVYAYTNAGYYFSDVIGPDVAGSPAAEATTGVWPFVNGPHNWTSGTHKFYGWLTKDANSNLGPEDLFGSTFSCVTTNKNVTIAAFETSTQTLKIPTTTMNPSAAQFDFMYSNIFTTEPINSPVQLEFSHLFAAYYFSFTNNSPQTLNLKSISLNVKSKASANLDFSSGTNPAHRIDFAANQNSIQLVQNISVGAGKTIDARLGNEIVSSDNTPSDSYRLIWPQNLTGATIDISFKAMISTPFYKWAGAGKGVYSVYKAVETTGGAYQYNGTYYIYKGKGNGTHDVSFKYNAKGDYSEVVPPATEQDVSRSISLAKATSGGEWEAGEKYNYSLSFSNDVVDLSVVVMKWDGGHGGNISFN